MKKLFIIVFIIILVIACKKETVKQNNCIIIMIEGEVIIKDQNDKKIQSNVGDKIYENFSVQTGNNSRIEILVDDKTNIRIKPNSLLKFSKLLFDGQKVNTKINLIKGLSLIKSEKLNDDSSFEIITETITVGIRGTKFAVENDVNNNSKVLVAEGKVAVKKNYNLKKIDEIEKKDKKTADDIKTKLDKEITVEKNEKIEISKKDFEEENENINNKFDNIEKKIDLKVKISDEEINALSADIEKANKRSINDEEKKVYFDINGEISNKDKTKESDKKNNKNIDTSDKDNKSVVSNSNIKSEQGTVLINNLTFNTKISLKTIKITPTLYKKIILETINNDVTVTRFNVIYDDESEFVISKNIELTKTENSPIHTIDIKEEKRISKIRIYFKSKKNISDETIVNVYGVK